MASNSKSKSILAEFDPSNKSVKFLSGNCSWSLFETVFQHECKKCHIYLQDVPMSSEEIMSCCFPTPRHFYLYKIYADLRRRGIKVFDSPSLKMNQVDSENEASPSPKRQKLETLKLPLIECHPSQGRFLTSCHLKSEKFIQQLLFNNVHIKSWSQMNYLKSNNCHEKFRGQVAEAKPPLTQEAGETETNQQPLQSRLALFQSIQHCAPKVDDGIVRSAAGTFRIADHSGNESTLFVCDNSSNSLETIMLTVESPSILALHDSEQSYFKVTPFEVWDEIK